MSGMFVASHRASSKRAERLALRRLHEAQCAWAFLVFKDHSDCIFPDRGLPVCSRDYYPGPPPEDEKLYEGTGLETLWDRSGKPNPHAWQLAGWNIKRGAR